MGGKGSGGRPTPAEIKRRRGNPGRRPLPDPGKVIQLPGAAEPPVIPEDRPLFTGGAAMWDRVWRAGRFWLSAGSDFDAVLQVCELMDERLALRVRVIQSNDRLDRVGLRALDTQIMTGLSELGFTPTGRARLGVAEVMDIDAVDDLAAIRAMKVDHQAAHDPDDT